MLTNTPKTEESANSPEKVTSLPEFMHWVTTAKEKAEKGKLDKLAFFYRGHSNCAYKLQPGAYREDAQGKSYRDHEHHLYQEMLRRNIAAFSEDKTTFERLVRMQHYELPTRLLDLTLNPLVALYFACKDHQGTNDGEVFLFTPKRLDVLNPSAVPEGALVGLDRAVTNDDLFYFFWKIYRKTESFIAKIKEGKNDIELDITKFYFDEFSKKNGKIYSYNENLPKLINLICLIFENIKNKFEIIGTNYEKFPKKEIINKSKFLDYSLELRKHFEEESEIIISDSKKYLFFNSNYNSIYEILASFKKIRYLYPPLNNERIQRQQGAFLIVPPLNPDELFTNDTDCYSVKINKNSKKKILEELESYGITESYLFPEPVKQAQHIKEIYAPKKST